MAQERSVCRAGRTNQTIQPLSRDPSASMRRYSESSCNNLSGRSCGLDILLAGRQSDLGQANSKSASPVNCGVRASHPPIKIK
jgi:hypothetical protein